MSVGIEQEPYIGVIVPEGDIRPGLDAQFRFRELTGDRIEVHHPFHGMTILGNGSAIQDPSLDAAAAVLFKKLPYLSDSMKLNRTRRFETRPFAGEYSQLSHCFSLGLLAVAFGGGPMDILDAFYNDASHIYDGHQGDDNYQDHGREDLHDIERARFFERAGIVDALIEAGAFRREPSGIYVGKTRLTIDRLLSEDEVTVRRSFLSNKHKARRLDADRYQYRAEESLLMRWAACMDMPDPGRIPKALAQVSLSNIARMVVLEGGEGDQLVVTDSQVALSDSEEYIRHNAEHWNEPVQDLVNDMLNLAERYFFICDNAHAKNFHYFYPRDYLHTSSSLMFEHFDKVAKDDPVMKWLLDTAERIAKDQQAKSLSYYKDDVTYSGPKPPEGVELEYMNGEIQGDLFDVVANRFVIQLPTGKTRTINPRVVNGGGITKPLSEIYPEFVAFSEASHRWIGNYKASIELPNSDFAQELGKAMKRIREEWPLILASRPHMPPKELRTTIDEANAYVKMKAAAAAKGA